MPLFTEAGFQYPVPAEVKVVLRYFSTWVGWSEYAVGVTKEGADRRWSTFPLITYSNLAKEQIIYEGSDRLTLTLENKPDATVLCIYESILESLEITYKFSDPKSSFPGLQCVSERAFEGDPRRALCMYSCLLNFKLVPKVRIPLAAELKVFMWKDSKSATMLSPGWVHVLWAVLRGHDNVFVTETILAGVYSWKKDIISESYLEDLRQIQRNLPELWSVLDRVMTEKHWEGYGKWLLEEDDGDSDDETETLTSPPGTKVQPSEEAERREDADPASEANPKTSSLPGRDAPIPPGFFPSTEQPASSGMATASTLEDASPSIESVVSTREVVPFTSRYVLIPAHRTSATADIPTYSRGSLPTTTEGMSSVEQNDLSAGHSMYVAENPRSANDKWSSSSSGDTLSQNEGISTPPCALPQEAGILHSGGSYPLVPIPDRRTSPPPNKVASQSEDNSVALDEAAGGLLLACVGSNEGVEDDHEADASSSPGGHDEGSYCPSPLRMHMGIKRSCSPFMMEEDGRSSSRRCVSFV